MAIIRGTLGTTGGDLILAGAGSEQIEGRAGNDIILAGAGNDTIFGDNFFGNGGGPLPPPYDSTPLPGNNIIFAGTGDDLVGAGFGADTVFGGCGNDTIRGYGVFGGSPSGGQGVIARDGADLLLGGAGDDSIDAGGGSDWLRGGTGADSLRGGVGADHLAGGTGRDVFVFASGFPFGPSDTGVGPDARDVVLDFRQGEDRIDLRGYANTFVQGQPSVFLGEDAAFRPSLALQVRSVVEDGHTLVQFVSVFGDPGPGIPLPTPSGPNGEIELAGVHHLTAADFILA